MTSLSANSRMKLNVVELAERASNVSFKSACLKAIGDLKGFTVVGSNVLVATYIKPRRTAGGIILSDTGVTEDRWQAKVGLVLKIGEAAFKYDGAYPYEGTKPKVGDFVVFHTSDTREIGIRGVSCRTIDSNLVRMIVPNEDEIGEIY